LRAVAASRSCGRTPPRDAILAQPDLAPARAVPDVQRIRVLPRVSRGRYGTVTTRVLRNPVCTLPAVRVAARRVLPRWRWIRPLSLRQLRRQRNLLESLRGRLIIVPSSELRVAS
jgi:hypothetical protein